MKNYHIVGALGFVLLIVASIFAVSGLFEKLPDKTVECDQTIPLFARAHHILVEEDLSIGNRYVESVGFGGAGNQVHIDIRKKNAAAFLNSTASWAAKYEYADMNSDCVGIPGREQMIRVWVATPKGPVNNFTYVRESYMSPQWYYRFVSANETVMLLEGNSFDRELANLCLLVLGWIFWLIGWRFISRQITGETKP